MAVGVVDATSEAIFRTVMSLGQSRSEWDFSLLEGRVVEHLDGHTDIIHKKLRSDWLPWGMKRRDLLLRRYWRREDDGTYVILYHSVFHHKCRCESGYIRACLKSGGYVISPMNQGKQMLGRVAALREFFRAKITNCPCSDFSSGELTKEIRLPQSEEEDIKVEVLSMIESTKYEDPAEGSQSSPKYGNVGGFSFN